MSLPTGLEKLLRERSARLAAVPEALLLRVQRTERQVLDRMLELVGQLEQRNGALVFSKTNLDRAAAINAELSKLLAGGEYASAVAAFAAEFPAQRKVQDAAFRRAFPSYTASDLAASLVTVSQRRAVDLLAGATLETNFLEPLADAITRAVTTGADWTDTLRLLRREVVGDAEYQGKLARHVKQVAWDALAVADRSYAAAVARELETEWWYYSGGELPTSREFCLERKDKYWHTEEVRAWARLTWAGKMEGVTTPDTIFDLLGGWNCRHTLMPVSAEVVPAEDRARAATAGYWQEQSTAGGTSKDRGQKTEKEGGGDGEAAAAALKSDAASITPRVKATAPVVTVERFRRGTEVIMSEASKYAEEIGLTGKIEIKTAAGKGTNGFVKINVAADGNAYLDTNTLYLNVNREGTMEDVIRTLRHEMTHLKQGQEKRLVIKQLPGTPERGQYYYDGKPIITLKDYDKITRQLRSMNPKIVEAARIRYRNLPWEKEAYAAGDAYENTDLREVLYYQKSLGL